MDAIEKMWLTFDLFEHKLRKNAYQEKINTLKRITDLEKKIDKLQKSRSKK